MICAAPRHGDRQATAIVDRGDEVQWLACELCAEAVQVFCPATRVRPIHRPTRNGPTTRSEATTTFPDRSQR